MTVMAGEAISLSLTFRAMFAKSAGERHLIGGRSPTDHSRRRLGRSAVFKQPLGRSFEIPEAHEEDEGPAHFCQSGQSIPPIFLRVLVPVT